MKTILISLFLVPTFLFCQDPEFTQFYANPLYLNPALAGSKVCPRFNLNYRNQWPGISGDFITSSVSFDKKLFRMHGGVGVLATNDRAGNGTLKTSRIGAMYSYHQPLGRRVSMNFALQADYAQKSVDWSKLSFGDMIDSRHGFVKYTKEVERNRTSHIADFSSGFLLYSNSFFAGGAVHHLFQPNESLLEEYSELPRKYTVHAGGNIPLNKGSHEEPTILSPNILYQRQGDFSQLNLGVYLKKGPIVGGLWYRNQDSFILLLGFQKDEFKFGYSYDVTVSRLTNATAGSHELSLGISLACKPPKKIYRPDICPSF